MVNLEMSDILTRFSVPIITAFIGVLASLINNERKKRSTRLKWAFSCLSNNKVISAYLSEFKDINSPSYEVKQSIKFIITWALVLPIFIFIGLKFLSFILGNYVTISTTMSTIYVLLLLILIFRFNTNLNNIETQVKSIYKDGDSLCDSQIEDALPKYREQVSKMIYVFSLYTYFIFLTGVLLYTFWTENSFSISNVCIFILYVMAIVLLGLRFFDLNSQLKFIIGKVLSAKYQNQFPFVYIKSKEFNYKGKVYNLCDDNLIFLNNNGYIISSEWEYILSVEYET
jgi:hypothetical protein